MKHAGKRINRASTYKQDHFRLISERYKEARKDISKAYAQTCHHRHFLAQTHIFFKLVALEIKSNFQIVY